MQYGLTGTGARRLFKRVVASVTRSAGCRSENCFALATHGQGKRRFAFSDDGRYIATPAATRTQIGIYERGERIRLRILAPAARGSGYREATTRLKSLRAPVPLRPYCNGLN